MLVLSLLLAVGCASDSQLSAIPADPALSITEPLPAAWVSAGELTVRGEARDLEGVTVNGQAVELAGDGTYTVSVEATRGITALEATGTDPRGDQWFVRQAVLAGEFAAPGDAVPEGITARVNQGGLDTVLTVASSMITPDLIDLSTINPVYSTSAALDLFVLSADIEEIDFSPLYGEADPQPDVLQVHIVIPDLFIDMQAYGEAVYIPYDVDASMWATAANINGLVTVDAIDGHLAVDMTDVQITFDGWGYDTSLIPYDLESYLFVETVQEQVESLLTEQVQEQVPPLLEETLSELELAWDLELMGRSVSTSAEVADASIDNDGLVVLLDVDVDVESQGNTPYAGVLAATHEADPTPSHTADMSLALSDDMLNRILFEAWRSELLSLRLSSDDGSLDPLLLAMLRAEEGTISTRADLPPVALERDGALILQLGELQVFIETPGGELGDYLHVAVTLDVPAEIAVTDGSLSLALGEPELTLAVRESDWGASEETVTRLLEDMLPLDTFLDLLSTMSLDIPELAGVTVESAVVYRDPAGVHTLVDAELR